MKKVKIIALLLVVISVLLTSCGEPEPFEPAPIITTEKETTEAVSYKYSDHAVFGVQMGMSVEETQTALNVAAPISVTDDGIAFFTVNKKGLDFVTDGLESTMYFIFDSNLRLCEVQYISTNDTGFDLDEATKRYNSLYGRHVKVKSSSGKMNYVWFSGGIYAVITTAPDGQNALSFLGEDYFKQNNTEEYEAYNKK